MIEKVLEYIDCRSSDCLMICNRYYSHLAPIHRPTISWELLRLTQFLYGNFNLQALSILNVIQHKFQEKFDLELLRMKILGCVWAPSDYTMIFEHFFVIWMENCSYSSVWESLMHYHIKWNEKKIVKTNLFICHHILYDKMTKC